MKNKANLFNLLVVVAIGFIFSILCKFFPVKTAISLTAVIIIVAGLLFFTKLIKTHYFGIFGGEDEELKTKNGKDYKSSESRKLKVENFLGALALAAGGSLRLANSVYDSSSDLALCFASIGVITSILSLIFIFLFIPSVWRYSMRDKKANKSGSTSSEEPSAA